MTLESNKYGIVGRSRAIADVIDRVDLVSATRSTVLITGETGTGKELVARAVHSRSTRRNMPFIKVNCAAIPETLLESELFGHVRGAFTDAASNRRGKFSLAHGGSIFLDEIGTMSLVLQAKLLRVLQEREIEPLGAERTELVDVRVIAATNRDLRQLVQEGRFQDDLFYRLAVIPIVVPPLRERVEDIPVLAKHFVEKHAARCGKPIEPLNDEVISSLKAYHWPGNVRELENTIERAVVIAPGDDITKECLRPEISDPRSVAASSHDGASNAAVQDIGRGINFYEEVRRFEIDLIRRALEQTGGHQSRAARLLGMNATTLNSKIKTYNINLRS